MKQLLMIVIGLIFVSASGYAEPSYSVLTGQSCFLCHENPSGRGLRSLYGSQYFAAKNLAVWPPTDSTLQKYSPQITPALTAGLDYRQIWMAEDPEPVHGEQLPKPISSKT